LVKLIVHCTGQQAHGPVYTPSDYGLGKELNYAELDRFMETPVAGGLLKEQLEGLYRLSGLQEGMLFHSLYDQRAGAYIEQFSCELRGLDKEAFRQSWAYLLRRHSILRSGFYADVFSIPVQAVYREVTLPVTEEDYRGLEGAEQAEAIRQYGEADRRQGFVMTAAPLMRIGLLRLEEDCYRMLWTHHHMLLDGWSVPVLLEELLTRYEELVTAKKTQIPTISEILAGEGLAQTEDKYEDYIRYIESRDKEKEGVYWREYLSGLTEATLLPFIKSTATRNKGIGLYQEERLEIKEEETERIVRFAQSHRLTVNTLMQAVWSYLLYRYTGNKDIVYGITVSGRPEDLPGVERRVGMYINTLPFHGCIKEDQDILSWLKGIQQEQAASREYQYSGLSGIQQGLGITGDLFDSLLVFENYPVSKVIEERQWSLGIADVRIHEQDNYPLSLTIGVSDKITVRFNYNTAFLEKVYVKKIQGHFEQVLRQFTSETLPNGLLRDISVLTLPEIQELLEEFNSKRADSPREITLADLFQVQAASTPDRIALQLADSQLTYRQLDERSNQLAHYLQKSGVGPESLVAICIERSLDMIVGIVGILKAGGAYVPIDPSYPQDRIGYMLEDMSASILLTSNVCRSKVPSGFCPKILELDKDWEIISDEPDTTVQSGTNSSQLAYAIYTSGSTGRPKGVLVEHRSVVNLIFSQTKFFNIGKEERILLFSNYCFDASVEQLFLALSNGATLVLFSEGLQLNVELFEHFLIEMNITHLHATPSFLENINVSRCEKLKRIVSGGEVCDSKLADRWNTQVDFYNEYGPTETAVTVIEHPCIAGQGNYLPIGRPLPNVFTCITDKKGELVPVGVTGELCLGGIPLARGYLNRPDLTKECFITPPFGRNPSFQDAVTSSTLYKTGDLCRWLPDGNIAYVGRNDNQVKIRGYRIEPEEIERLLEQSGLVRQLIVLPKTDGKGNRRLVGYVVADDGLDSEKLFAYAKSQLPEYMIPSLFVMMDQMPLTTNGKIDRERLPAPDFSDRLRHSYTAPRNGVEQKLTEIWQRLLAIERIGIHDDFFELGGNSLLATRMMSAIYRELDVKFPIKFLFQLTTIELMAKYIGVGRTAQMAETEGYTSIRI
ncbi:amino acid adenylation domain-containing protein, partial [Flavitalea flava]